MGFVLGAASTIRITNTGFSLEIALSTLPLLTNKALSLCFPFPVSVLSVWQGAKGIKVNFLPFSLVLDWPWWATLLSSCQGLPRSRWQASIGSTSHISSSLYSPIEKATKVCLETVTSFPFLIHCTVYGLGRAIVAKLSLSTNTAEVILVQLPPSMIRL